MASSTSPRLLRKRLISALEEAADPAKAPVMQAYMKSSMPFYGVQTPILTKICRELYQDLSFESLDQWEETVRTVWDKAKHREERYAALQLCSHRASRELQIPKALELYEHMVVSGAWWDFVDDLASNKVGGLLRSHTKAIRPKMLKWSTSKDMWKRRVSILCQLRSKKEMDLELLYACIEPSLDSKEFFLQKAIGWALRELAWSNPAETKRYVAENSDRLAPLSRREALKNLNKTQLRATT